MENEILKALSARKSVRVFTDRPVTAEERAAILEAAFQAPTAGNQQLYTILDITDQALKERLADLCDHQPFIAKAPLCLVFLADCRRWPRAYRAAGTLGAALAATEPSARTRRLMLRTRRRVRV